MTTLSSHAIDGSTYVVTAAFADAAGTAVIPDSIKWTLSNGEGTVIGDRTDVAIAVPAASVDIVLSGADLDYDDGPWRVMIIEAVYDSTEGDDLPLKAGCLFRLDDLPNV